MLGTKEKQIQLFGALSLLLASFFSLGYHHFDEHFQIFEFAGLKLGLVQANELPWEYGAQMRPTIQPLMVYGVHRFFESIGFANPFFITWFFRFVSAILTFYSIRLMYFAFKENFQTQKLKDWFLIFSFLLWFVIYNGVRFSSENWSQLFFIIPFALYFKWKPVQSSRFFLLGLLLGLAFEFRFQTAFLIIGFIAWLTFIRKEKWKYLLSLTTGGLLVVALGIFSDFWYYEEWTFSPWNYFFENVVDDKSSHFGVSPWWWYFTRFFIQGIPPLSILITLCLLFFFYHKRKSPFTWSIVPFLLVHFLVAHKEMRFLFPIVGLLPFAIVKALELFQQIRPAVFNHKLFTGFIKFSIIANIIFTVIVSFRPADPQISLYKSIYKNYDEPTVLYHLGKNPYHRILEIRYYKRKNLTVKAVQSLADISTNSKQKQLVVFGGKDRPTKEFEQQNTLIYSTFPKWIKHFNFNDWQRRTKIWSVYELNK